jgi:hypothetical protein
MRRAITSVLAVTGTLAALIVGAPPAAAATTVTLLGVQANGQVGVPQYLTATVAVDGSPCGSVLTPPVNIIATGTNNVPQVIGSATFSSCVGSVFQYTFQWLPAAAGPIWVNADVNGTASTASRTQIAAVPTTTRVQSPSVAQIGVPVTLTASVTANNGSQASPQGTIQFSILGGGNIGGPVALNNAVPSTVQIQWTPAAVGLQNIVATYIPGANSANFTCQGSCTSAVDPVQVTTTGVLMFLSSPPQFNVGVPATLTAVVNAVPPSGSVTFTVNGSVIAANVPVQSGGLAQAAWTPPTPGQFTIAANWRSGTQTAGAQEVVNVGTAPATPDVITLGPVGQPAWSPLGVYTLANGSSVTFATRTASGAPVTLTDAGPCGLQGNVFTVTSGTGQCRVIATSPGGNGYGGAQAIYTVNLTPGVQTSVAPIRASGRVNRNTTIVLARPGQNITNAGQEMDWRVTEGRNSCQLRFPANGAVQLRTVRQGSCTVRATAPAIGGQWNRMVINRTYRVR